MSIEAKSKFRDGLEALINFHSMENGSNSPDFVLAEYLNDCLTAYDKAVKKRDEFFGYNPREDVSAEIDTKS